MMSLFPEVERSFLSKYLYEREVVTSVRTETTRMWVLIETSSATIKVENPTPAIPPVLQRPWKDPFILFSNFFCNARAWVFNEIFKMRMLKAKTQMDAIKATLVVANPIDKSDNARMINATVIGFLLSYLATNQPETGSPMSELIGINRRIVPNCASLYPKKVLIVGILEAQVEKQMPERKKKMLKKIRCRVLSSKEYEFD
jgi:hypothetical protein